MSACAVCGASPLTRVLEARSTDGATAWLGRCPGCTLVQVLDRPDRQALADYYSRYSYAGESAWAVPEATVVALDRLASSLAVHRRTNRCLDVGCGAGAILEALKRNGWEAEGTELSATAADRLEGRGFRIHRGPIEELDLPRDAFDVVVLSEVVEHLRDPAAALRKLVPALRRGGIVYLTTPNFQSLSRRLLGARWRVVAVPEHLYYFSPRALGGMLRAVGLQPLRVWTVGLNPFELLEGLRAPREQVACAPEAASAQSRGDALRLAAVRRPWVRAAKALLNAALRLSGLGDTLKGVAARG